MTFKQAFFYFLYWTGNVFFKTLKWRKRDSNLWLFGAWRGLTYSDNSKYLFEYVQKKLPDVRAVWITKNLEVKRQLSQKGFECYLSSEKKARQLRLRAGCVFFTNGAHDFGNLDLCQGALKIALWHGMPLKRIFFASNRFNLKKGLGQKIQYVILKIYNKAERQISIATSENTRQFITQSFEVKPENVWITGQPRNDALFDQKSIQNNKRRLNLTDDEKVVLYMPTWRETGHYDDFFQTNSSFLEKVINQLKSDKIFMRLLKDLNIRLLIKPHPNRIVNENSEGNIEILKEQIINTQDLMAVADCLITDYSSTFIDFALTEKPVHFYVPDLTDYRRGQNGLFLTFDQFASFWFGDFTRLKEVIIGKRGSAPQGLANMRQINRLFNDKRLRKGTYCKTFIKTFLKKTKN